MYLSWAAFYEGPSDRAYFDILLPRLLSDILGSRGERPFQIPATPAVYILRNGRDIGEVAQEICDERDAFHLLFLHADTGGRELEERIHDRREAFIKSAGQRCGWPEDRVALLSPRHEMEAWALADGNAVCRALGFQGQASKVGLPQTAAAAERLVDPKRKLEEVVRQISGRRVKDVANKVLPLIAQEQDLDLLRGSDSFQRFEASLSTCLVSLGCIKEA